MTSAPVTAFLRPAKRVSPLSKRLPPSSIVLSPEAKSYPVPVWSGLISAKHRDAMGISLWTFLWLLDRITTERDGWGIVLGGKPVKDTEIAKCLGVHKNAVHAERERLLEREYITARRTPYGFVYQVRKSRKFGIWSKKRVTGSCDSPPERVTGSCGSEPQEVVIPESQDPVITKKTQQLKYSSDAAVVPQAATATDPDDHWKAIGCGLAMGTREFRNIWKFFHGNRNGAPISEAMERTILRAQDRNISIPRPFYEAKRRVEADETKQRTSIAESRMLTADDIEPKER
jgi:hypothetical protein